MKFIKEWSDYNPKIDKRVKDFVDLNKYNLPQLWNDDLSEEENIEFMINYFNTYPGEMESELNIDNIKKATRNRFGSLRDYAPILQRFGGVYDFKSF